MTPIYVVTFLPSQIEEVLGVIRNRWGVKSAATSGEEIEVHTDLEGEELELLKWFIFGLSEVQYIH